MPSYTQCSKDEATHLYNTDPSTSSNLRGDMLLIVQKVDDGCLVRKMPDGPHYFVRHCHSSYYKEYVPPVVTFGVGRMGQTIVRAGVLDTVILGQGRDRSRKEVEDFITRSKWRDPKWTHVITYHDGKPVGIEELQ